MEGVGEEASSLSVEKSSGRWMTQSLAIMVKARGTFWVLGLWVVNIVDEL